MTTPPRTLLCVLSLLGPALACPGDDDDSAVDDDDTPAGDDDTGDDDTGDDDTGDDDDDDDDDDSVPQDYDAATVPEFAACVAANNQWTLMLGDGALVGPFDGFQAAPASFANNNGQWTLRLGTGASFAQLQGNRTGYPTSAPITMQGPAATAGNVVANVLIDAAALGASPAALAGGYGLPNVNADVRVGGTVTFTTLPEPGATATGTFEAILQNQQQLAMGNVVLLGIRGCFAAPLVATD